MILAQITITSGQIAAFKELISAIGTVASLWAITQRAITASRNKLHAIMTDNANRTRDELAAHIDAKFKEHEDSAFSRLDTQDTQVARLSAQQAAMQKQLDQIVKTLNGFKP